MATRPHHKVPQLVQAAVLCAAAQARLYDLHAALQCRHTQSRGGRNVVIQWNQSMYQNNVLRPPKGMTRRGTSLCVGGCDVYYIEGTLERAPSRPWCVNSWVHRSWHSRRWRVF